MERKEKGRKRGEEKGGEEREVKYNIMTISQESNDMKERLKK